MRLVNFKLHVELLHTCNILGEGVDLCVISCWFLWKSVYLCARGKALDLWQARETATQLAFLPTFMVELDIVLHGGLLAGSITEVCYLIS